MTSLERAPQLLGWGDHAVRQAEAVRRAGVELGIPVERPAAEGYRDEGDPEGPETTVPPVVTTGGTAS